MITVHIIPNEKGNPPGKLADAELRFDGIVDPQGQDDASASARSYRVLDGLKLIGFSIWERRTGGGRNVTFPARQYSVNGERRSFSLLRPTGDIAAPERLRDLILAAYAEHEANGGAS